MSETPVQPEGEPSAVTKNTENRVPQSRFNEMNQRAKDAEARLVELEKQFQTQRDSELAEQNKWQELAESRAIELKATNAKAARVDELEAVLQQTIDARIKAIPENMRNLVPSHGTPQERLAWINQNAANLTRPLAPNLDGGAGGNSKQENLPGLTNEERAAAVGMGYTAEEYAKRKAENAERRKNSDVESLPQ